MGTKVHTTWAGKMAFEAKVGGFNFMIDATEAVGGENKGPQPKSLSLVSLAGCTAMDVISILGKMRIVPDYFDVEVEGELTDEHPKIYHTINIRYIFKGEDLPMDKLEKAAKLSQDRYCGVSEMLRRSAKINYEIVILDE